MFLFNIGLAQLTVLWLLKYLLERNKSLPPVSLIANMTSTSVSARNSTTCLMLLPRSRGSQFGGALLRSYLKVHFALLVLLVLLPVNPAIAVYPEHQLSDANFTCKRMGTYFNIWNAKCNWDQIIVWDWN